MNYIDVNFSGSKIVPVKKNYKMVVEDENLFDDYLEPSFGGRVRSSTILR